ncbi:MAG: hypothetical protein M3N30_12585, partial [Bacteroidota bacterium]|nr:hypothetical protein [Bacteroidota bacterium]
TNFSADPGSNAVTINGVAATVTSATSTLLTTVVPLSATTGKIVVTVKGQPSTSANNILIKNLMVTTLAGTGIGGVTDGPANTASFSSAWGIVSDGNGNYFIADAGNNKVRKLSSAGVVSTVAGTGVWGNNDGPAATATFGAVYGIALDSHGNIFVTILGRNNIREISTSGIVSTFAGDINGNTGSTDGIGTAARFNTPLGIAIDKNDNIFVMDASNLKVRKITPAGVVSTLAGSGLTGSADGAGSAASFNNAWGLGIDANGNLYVCDVGNNKIRKVTQAGVVSTFAGSGVRGSADGPALSASFSGAIGIVADQAGNFYVTDEENHRIRMISSDGQVYTLAGNGDIASKDGSGNFASFSHPLGITIDASGVMAVVDNGTQKIRKIVVQ